MMTSTKATGPLAVLEAAFEIIPGKETAFLAYQASVVPLAATQPGFRAAYSGPVWDTTWAWKSSSSYRALQSLGDVSSELFVPLVETRPREHLRDDKLQRDWEWTHDDRR